MNKDAIPDIKSSVVGIGLVSNETMRMRVLGSGFVINSDEYIITASHVIQDCVKLQEQLSGTEKTFLTVFDYQSKSDGTTRLISAPFEDNYRLLGLKPSFESEGHNLDVGLLRPLEPKPNHKYLHVSNRINFSVLEEVYLCGYPGGNFSFKPSVHPADVSLSPVLQYGRISALKPSDDAPKHQGIITDIIGVGGSSGSPILEANTGDVIGIAQQVIPGSLYDAHAKYTERLYHTETETGKLVETELSSKAPATGFVNEGLVFGFSNIMFNFVVPNAKKILDENVDLSQFEVDYTISTSL